MQFLLLLSHGVVSFNLLEGAFSNGHCNIFISLMRKLRLWHPLIIFYVFLKLHHILLKPSVC